VVSHWPVSAVLALYVIMLIINLFAMMAVKYFIPQ